MAKDINPKTGEALHPEKVEGIAFQINENSVNDKGPRKVLPAEPPQQQSGTRSEKVEGKAFQVNEKSVDNPKPADTPPRRE
ncbi:hypothetical protein LGH82_29385 [Mesorhizobium sp. PAMC28654]|uniref:hypothetical protein n=1 Tax=Mesorhizobium sp. PAMC28654 TaxID=2880934 RepID=UPI001D0ADAB8|nr:hypothetical protein [Mesorhizobium sp. PAMC28654]UDL89142.1 hypothetical protein LGH82_29385 [Mesorhizobium sp. PAMC28654]